VQLFEYRGCFAYSLRRNVRQEHPQRTCIGCFALLDSVWRIAPRENIVNELPSLVMAHVLQNTVELLEKSSKGASEVHLLEGLSSLFASFVFYVSINRLEHFTS